MTRVLSYEYFVINLENPLTASLNPVQWPPFLREADAMADDIDLANDLMNTEISRALSKIRESAPQGTNGAKFCVECGDTMPLGRKKLGFKLCVPCAEERERKKQLFAN